MRGVRWIAVVLLAGRLHAVAKSAPIADFEGADALAQWTFARDSGTAGASGSLTLGQGHSGKGAVLAYRFVCSGRGSCNGAVAAVWTPPKGLTVKHHSALSLWIRAAPDVQVTLLLTDKDGVRKRYPFEVATLENIAGDWRLVSIPLGAKSTGYGDEDHTGSPKRIQAIAILVELRRPQTASGSVSFDDLSLLDSADQDFILSPDAELTRPPADSASLGPRLGINIHTFDARMLDLAREAGFRFVRADLLWRQAERNGAYRFFGFDRLLSALESRSMGALWILDYGHPQHGGDRPRTGDDVAAFAGYAGAVAAHFKGRNVRYEIWNEPNTERFWPPAPNADEFAALLKAAIGAMRQADPEARIASGGLARIDLPYLKRLLEAGGALPLNAIGVHPYRKSGPETFAAELFPLWGMARGALGDAIEIWDTEWGYASYDYFSQNLSGDGHSAAGRHRQAVLALREALTVWSLGLPAAVWYDLRDDGGEPRNPEHNYGLLDAANAPKPAMNALIQLSRIAANHSFAGMIAGAPDGVHTMRLDGAADRVFVVWNDQPDASISMQYPRSGEIAATNLFGEPLKIKNGSHGDAEFPLLEKDGPIYVSFGRR